MKLFAHAATAIALVALCCAQGASAASWSPQKLAIPQGPTGAFRSVSCVTGGCIGVGSAVDPTGHGVPMAQRWTSGAAWGALAPINPPGATATILTSVSCTSINSCTALGYTAGGSSQGAFSENWDGSSWSNPLFVANTSSGQRPDVGAISCFAVGSCIAAGSVSSGSPSPPFSVPAVAVLAGGSWKSIALANPVSGSFANLLDSISCSTASSCMAVGHSSTTGGTTVPFTEQLTKNSAGTWSASAKPTSLPATDTSGYLNSVSCTAANACFAIGYATGTSANSYRGNYYVSWGGAGTGTAWSAAKPVSAANAFTQLSSISCVKAASAACVAVGFGAASQLSGTTWTQLAPPLLTLDAVSCTAANACTAVGGSGSFFGFGPANQSRASGDQPPLGPAASFAAAEKAAQTVPAPGAERTGATAPRPESTTTTAPGTTVAARWTGGAGSAAWATQSTLSPVGAQNAGVARVSCAGGRCLAIGSEFAAGAAEQPLAEAGPGTWTIQSGIGATSGSYDGYLSDVSCVPAGTVTKCLVVGALYSFTQSGAMSQLVTSGPTWSAAAPVYLKLPTGATWIYVNGVSCTTASSCTAVGDYYNSSVSQTQPLVEHWNGSSWAIQPIQSPSTTQSVTLNGVSCVGSGCSVVGTQHSSTFAGTAFGETWNGSKYVPQTLHLPPGTTSSSLAAVSCSAAGTCTGVGSASGSSFFGPLAERLTAGSWSSQSFTAGTFATLGGISCPTNSSCTAVGGNAALSWTSSGWGNPVTLLPPADEGFYAAVGGVSCSSATSCTAVGAGFLAVNIPLAEILS